MKKVLTIAGSDSSGGAGVQADLKTIALLGCHGSSAITALTAQNSLGVQGVYPTDPEGVYEQIESVLSDIGADAVKTGMLFSTEIIEAVAKGMDDYPVAKLVVDPVMIAKGGTPLLKPEAQKALVERIIPKASLVTPNLPEAKSLTGIEINSIDDCKRAAEEIIKLGAGATLIKGGHSKGRTVEDLLYSPETGFTTLRAPRIETKNTHGTGCTLSAAIASRLALGDGLIPAVTKAHGFLQLAIAESYELGAGHGPTNPFASVMKGSREAALARLRLAWEELARFNPVGLIPEVQTNLAEALVNASSFEDVAGFPGRIIRHGDRVARVDGPAFGATRHMAKILLASVRFGSPFRAVINIRYGEDVLAACADAGMVVEGFSRYDEPPEVKALEGSTLEWGTSQVLERCERAPDVIYDEGDVGKEPMVRVFGEDALEAVRKVEAIYGKLEK